MAHPIPIPQLYLEKVGGLPESHLAAADHIDGVLERLVLAQLAPVDRDALVLEPRLGGRRC